MVRPAAVQCEFRAAACVDLGGREEHVHHVEALADEAALPEQVLVDVGDGGVVGVDADVVAVQLAEARLEGGGEVDADSRLQDAVALRHHAQLLVEVRRVERMSDDADQPAGRIAGQRRVLVQRDDVHDLLQEGRGGGHVHVGGVGGAAQQLVQLVDLAPLPLPAHPAALAGVPLPVAVEDVEARVVGRVAPVQLRDAGLSEGQQRPVSRRGLAVSVGVVCQQRE